MIPENSWLDPDWFDDDLYQTYHALKGMLIRRGFKISERKRLRSGYAAILQTEGELKILILGNSHIYKKLEYLIHEFCHYELGHRDMKRSVENAGQAAMNEIECCFVTEVVYTSLGMRRIQPIYIYKFPVWVEEYRKNAVPIAAQIGKYWP